MKPLLAFLFASMLCLSAPAMEPVKGFKMAELNIGYMPDSELGSRVGVPALADYVKKLQASCEEFFANTTTPENLDIVVVVKPGKAAKVWFVSPRKETEKRDPLRTKLEAVTPPDVTAPIAFAIESRIGGGVSSEPSKTPPMRSEWKTALSKLDHTARFDEMLGIVWPDPAGSSANKTPGETTLPAGFVNQVLEPTKGKILRPKDWHYTENHHDYIYEWIISREEPAKDHSYTTGHRIRAFIGVKENTKKSAEELINDFVAGIAKDSTKWHEVCEKQDQGLFTRRCIDAEQGNRRIHYSLFWGNKGLDIAVITEATTTKDLWDSYASTFDRMTAFELIDMTQLAAKETFKVPKGVNYKEATPGLNEKAKKLLLAKFSPKASGKDILSLFSSKLICGPGMWKEIKQDKGMSGLAKGKVSIHVDADTLEGKLFQSPDELLLFWKALLGAVDISDYKIRRLTEEELTIYWAMISFDIEEPVFILESKGHKILVNFISSEELKIMWIDDLQNFHMKKKPTEASDT